MGNCCRTQSRSDRDFNPGQFHLESSPQFSIGQSSRFSSNTEEVHADDHEGYVTDLMSKSGAIMSHKTMAFLQLAPRGRKDEVFYGEKMGLFMSLLLKDVDSLAAHTDAPKFLDRVYASEALSRKIRMYGVRGLSNMSTALYGLYSIREFSRAKHDLEPYIAKIPEFCNFSVDQVWRMLIDRGAWDDGDHGGLRFENEPGYMAGMLDGLRCVLENQHKNTFLDTDLLIKLHDTAIAGVFGRFSLDKEIDNYHELPTFHEFFGERSGAEGIFH